MLSPAAPGHLCRYRLLTTLGCLKSRVGLCGECRSCVGMLIDTDDVGRLLNTSAVIHLESSCSRRSNLQPVIDIVNVQSTRSVSIQWCVYRVQYIVPLNVCSRVDDGCWVPCVHVSNVGSALQCYWEAGPMNRSRNLKISMASIHLKNDLHTCKTWGRRFLCLLDTCILPTGVWILNYYGGR